MAAQNLQIKLLVSKEKGLSYLKILTKNKTHSRSSVKITENGKTLNIEINAKDSTALRSSINSILRDLQVIEATKLD